MSSFFHSARNTSITGGTNTFTAIDNSVHHHHIRGAWFFAKFPLENS